MAGIIEARDRGKKYEDPLQMSLMLAGLGSVACGCAQLGQRTPDGTRPIEFWGIDVDVADLLQALDLLRDELRGLAAPDGTEIHYTYNGRRLKDELREGNWSMGLTRTLRHPAFGY